MTLKVQALDIRHFDEHKSSNSQSILSLAFQKKVAKQLNNVRLSRAVSSLTDTQQHLFHLIPFLFQYHHPNLPGCNEPFVACGIWNYQDSQEIISACQALNIRFNFEQKVSTYAFEGIYAMGSTASFGQNNKSDIDIWLVHSVDITTEEKRQIRNKANQLTLWFAGFDLEVNFYLVAANQFIDDTNKVLNCNGSSSGVCLGKEHSGTSQHWLLLEEFYRSHICLAGKQVCWWSNCIYGDEALLYLGDVHQLPATEYLGSALWHLYKGLSKPHKSLLKVMLLEAYASEYPKTELIVDTLWQRTLEQDFSEQSDAYYLLYQYIESYLLKNNEIKRLEIVRRCFYLKCGVRLTQEHNKRDWRYNKMLKLVNHWGWEVELLTTLDDCEHWHSEQLIYFNQQLNELMLISYQKLQQFAASHKLTSFIRADELAILSRKLHTHFNQDPTQLIRVNPLWSKSVSENELIVYQGETFSLVRFDIEQKKIVPIYSADSLIAIIYWACINGVANKDTQWFFNQNNSNVFARNITELSGRILAELPEQLQRVSKENLFNPWYFKHIILILNFDNDPTSLWRGQEVMVDRLNANVFSLGRKQQNMLASVDMLYLNSWGEFHCTRFQGKQCIFEFLSFVASVLRRTDEDPNLFVLSQSAKLKSQLEHTVVNLVRQAARLCHHGEDNTMLLQPLLVEKTKYGIFYTSKGMSWQDLSDTKSLYQQFFKGYLVELPRENGDAHPLASLPNAAQLYATLGVTQYFLYQQGLDVNVYVLDEANQLQYFVQRNSDMSDMVSNVSHQYVFEQHHSVGERFNMPQFFRLNWKNKELTVEPFGLVPEQSAHEF